MRIPFFKSLPARLAGWILVLSAVVLLGLTELNRRAVERILGDQAEVQAAMATDAVVDGLDGTIGSAERLTRLVARQLQGRSLTSAEVNQAAHDAIVDSPNVFGFSIAFEPGALAGTAGRFGTYIHRSDTRSRFVTRDLAAPDQAYWERDWYRGTIEKGQLVWSEPFFDRGGSDRNVVRVSAPFFHAEGDEHPAGVVAAVIELDWLRHLANVNEFSDTSHVIVFSRTGRLILHPKPGYEIAETMESLAEKTGAPEFAAIRQNVVARRQGSTSFVDPLTGRRIHANYRPSKIAGWGVVVEYDESEFLKDQRRFRIVAAVFLSATLVLLGAIVIGVTRHALRPLGPLVAATREIARGNLDQRLAPPDREDEIGQLTRAFEAMRDTLQAQHLERQWAAQSIEHQLRYNQLIIDSIGELVFVLTKALNISRINPAVSRVTGYVPAELVKVPLSRLIRLAANTAHDLAPLTAAIQAGEPAPDLDVTLMIKNGTALPARLTLVPLYDGNRVVGAVVTVRPDSPAPGTVV